METDSPGLGMPRLHDPKKQNYWSLSILKKKRENSFLGSFQNIIFTFGLSESPNSNKVLGNIKEINRCFYLNKII